jgi:hypothetical protein
MPNMKEGTGQPYMDDSDIFDRLAAEDAQMQARLKAMAEDQRAELDALLVKLQDELAGIRIPPPSIVAEPASGRGRRPKLTAETCWTISYALSQGTTLREAARMAGVGRTSLHRWLSRGRREAEGPYRDFWNRIREVSTLTQMEALVRIRRSDDWRAHAWFLEHRYLEFPRFRGRVSACDLRPRVDVSVRS